jgi:1-acyl-sn-glycerol-3-phosphate acyltransferase
MQNRCQAMTKAGKPCQNYAQEDSAYCRLHQPLEKTIEPEPDVETAVLEDDIPIDDESYEEHDVRHYLREALKQSIDRLQAISPDFVPPPFSPERMKSLARRLMKEAAPYLPTDRFKSIQEQIGGDLLDIETWKGIWYILTYTVQYQLDFLKRRVSGDYEVDEWGMDWEFLEAIRPMFDFLYTYYWRVETTGLENISDYARGLIVANHSGQLPFDATMIATAVFTEHPAQRLVRNLYPDWYPQIPIVAPVLKKIGQVLGNVENGTALLAQEELVAIYPEGDKGVSKLYRDRYNLADFDTAFVKMALATGAPIVPTAVIGAEELYVSVTNASFLAKLFRTPYFPITLRFPWFGLLGLIPYPTKWYIDFGTAIETEAYGPEAVDDDALVQKLAKEVRDTLPAMLIQRLMKRKSILFRS